MIVALSTIHLWMFLTFIAVVWVVFERSLAVASNQSALVQTMQTTLQPLTQRPNLQLGAVYLWTQKTFRILILTIQLTSQDGLIQRGDSLWQNIAPGGQSIILLFPQTPIFSSFTQLQFDVFWGTLMDTNFHKHQVIDWTFMLCQSVMEDLIPKFEACCLYHFMGQRTDFNEMAVKQFLATAEIDIDEQLIT